ncbi:MFS general substrate transporter [Jackrogersella minutella]|nr:MFS general substrate transporter [Jackrogersella minutella]
MSHKHEASRSPSATVSNWRLLIAQDNVNDEILYHRYTGSGTQEDPYRVEWLHHDPIDPLTYPTWKKWTITLIMAFSTLAITFASSGLSGADPQLMLYFGASQELVTADVSLFVLSFAIGPAIWGPLSELYGRQYIFAGTFAGVTIFSSAVIASNNIATLLVLRFFAGALGASVITNAAGVISDLFTPRDRGLAGIVYTAAPFLGPTIGPVTCGFLAQYAGWKWVAGLMAIVSGICWLLGLFFVPETYAPILLRRRAAKLSKLTGHVYKSKLEADAPSKRSRDLFYSAIVRPWTLLFREPIVLLCSIYIAVVYGTLYLSFAAFPIVFTGHRGWSQGVSGLSFLGIMAGQVLGMVYAVFDTKRYKRIADSSPKGRAPPEAWLAPSCVGAVALPIGLFWFAWTNGNEIHWIVSLIGIAPFGFGQVLVFLSISQYLLDAYGIYAASCLAANAAVRAMFGAAFPLFSGLLYDNLGIHWGASIPAFLAAACLPVPFLFHRYGLAIRKRCTYSSDAMRITEEMSKKAVVDTSDTDATLV